MHNKKKIKLLFRHRSMEMGGVEKVLLSLLNHLNQDLFEMTVCLNLNQGELRDDFPKHVRKVYLTNGKEDLSTNSFVQKLQLLSRKNQLEKLRKNPKLIDEKFLKEKYDIEIGMTYNDFESVLNSSNKNSKKVGWFHSEIQLPKLQPVVSKILEHFPQFDYMVYCSHKIKELMHHYYPNLNYPSERVIINMIPIDEIKNKAEEKLSETEKSLQSPKPNFVSIGRLHSRKGYHKLMNVHAQLLKDGFQHSVLIIGDGEELASLQAQQKKLGVEKTFILAGNKMNPYPYLKNADFFIMPSESEAWPLVIAEALILQKPIIATKVGDVETMIENRKTGYLIHDDEKEMYDSMKEFITNQSLISHLKENLLEIEKQFDGEKIIAEIEEIFINLVQSKN